MQGSRLKGGHCKLIGEAACLAWASKQLPCGSHCSSNRAVAKKHPEFWDYLQPCVDEAAMPDAQLPTLRQPGQLSLRQAVAQAHAALPA